jgi:uncharacterized protein (DUF3820 family)
MQTFPFGQYKGQAIERVPADYLKWVLTLPDLFAETRKGVQAELDRRVIERIDRENKPEKPGKPADQRLLAKGWLYCRSQGRYSRWVERNEKSRGWACYMVPCGVAKTVQDYLDSLKAKRRAA